jgi:flagellar motor switch protein FliG
MSAKLDERIRQVAIVLASVDADTARDILSQLPDDHAERVRRTCETLGQITEAERQKAFDVFRNLANRNAPNSRSNSHSTAADDSRLQRNTSTSAKDAPFVSNSFRPRTIDLDSVAMEFLSEELAAEDLAGQGLTPNSPCDWPLSSSTSHPSHVSLTELVSCLEPSDLSKLFGQERPIIVAAMLQQVSDAAAAKILQALPKALAASSIACLPDLHNIQPDVIEHLRQMIVEYRERQGSNPPEPTTAIDRVKSILSHTNPQNRRQWLEEIGRVDQQLARQVGWESSTNPVSELSSIRESGSITNSDVMSNSWQPEVQASESNSFDSSLSRSEQPSAIANEKLNNLDSIPPAEKLTGMTFDQVCELPTDELSQVVKSCDPQSILTLLSLRNEVFSRRVIQMFTPKESQRIQERIATMAPVSSTDIERARTRVCTTAVELFAQGKIGTLFNLTITAAA